MHSPPCSLKFTSSWYHLSEGVLSTLPGYFCCLDLLQLLLKCWFHLQWTCDTSLHHPLVNCCQKNCCFHHLLSKSLQTNLITFLQIFPCNSLLVLCPKEAIPVHRWPTFETASQHCDHGCLIVSFCFLMLN